MLYGVTFSICSSFPSYFVRFVYVRVRCLSKGPDTLRALILEN